MTHKNVLGQFKNLFPLYFENIKTWYPNGKNRIRFEMNNGDRFIFTYNGRMDWRFETMRKENEK